MRNTKGFWAVALGLHLLASCQRPPPLSRTADQAYNLRHIIRAQQLTSVHPCNPGTSTVVSGEDLATLMQVLKSDGEFLQTVVGIKLLQPVARAQLMQDSRSIQVACVGTKAPGATISEQRLANAIVDLADTMADRIPGPDIESTIMKLQHKR